MMNDFLMELAKRGLPSLSEPKAMVIYKDILEHLPRSLRKPGVDPTQLVINALPDWIKAHSLFIISEYYTVENGNGDKAYQHCLLQALFEEAHVNYYLLKGTDLSKESGSIKIRLSTPHILYPWQVRCETGYEVLPLNMEHYLQYAGISLDKYVPLVGPLLKPALLKRNPDYIFYGTQEQVKKKLEHGGKAYRNIWYREGLV